MRREGAGHSIPHADLLKSVARRSDAAFDQDVAAFSVTSSGLCFGEPGFYFIVSTDKGFWAKYVRAMRESIKVYPSESASVRADHVLRIWGATFLRLHYKLIRVPASKIA